jgi:ABC-2 type transport system ATP-binding protein
MNTIIRVENLTKEFVIRKRSPGFVGSVRSLFHTKREVIRAVDDIGFTVERGELVGYLGPNGAGKSTTIKMLTGILRPSDGSVRVNGIDPYTDRKKLTRQIGVVFGQKTQLWWDLPVGETFDLLRTIYGIPREEYRKRMEFFNDLLGLGAFLDQQTRKLSLGQRMRTDLAASLIHNPPVLFLDEPTIGLDIITRDSVRRFIKELNEVQKTTILLTTHDMGDIEYLAQRLILLDRGKIHYDGSITEFTERYATERVLTVHLETPCEESIFTENGFQILRRESDMHYLIRLGQTESMGPLIGALSRAGVQIREISVQKQDLAETLKLIYRGKNIEL